MDEDKTLSMEELSMVTGGSKQDVFKILGTVIEILPNAMVRVELSNGQTITAQLSGKLRMSYIKILPGDKVDVELTPYDRTRGIIIARHK